jgi:hypothetical protein
MGKTKNICKLNAIKMHKRWANIQNNLVINNDNLYNQYSNDLNNNIQNVSDLNEAVDFNNNIENLSDINATKMIDASTSTNKKYLYSSKNFEKDFRLKILCIILDILRSKVIGWNSIHERVLSIFIDILLRIFQISYETRKILLKKLNCNSVSSCQEWYNKILLNENDPFVIITDKRGGYRREEFYELYPELEIEAKLYALEQTSKKSAIFTTNQLALFLTKRFEEINEIKLNDGQLIRSEASCRLDLLKWGACWEKNSSRPYFEGHERPDVIEQRQNFIKFFHENKHLYTHPHPNKNIEMENWYYPSEINVKSRILITHDESTFKSGEVQTQRWLFPDNAPFFNKGSGRSLMLSYFLVQNDEYSLFDLNEEEWNEAIKNHESLNNDDDFMNYENRSANAFIQPGKDSYFNNSNILKQFERLFILLKFKKSFFNHDIDIIVDNARTHTAMKYDISKLSIKSNTKCPYRKIEWYEGNNLNVVECYDENNNSKGLFQLAKEMKLFPITANVKDYNLENLRKLFSKHPAFTTKSSLEILGELHGVNIKFCPKFHCELNPIEGLWCLMKQYVRKRNDQTFNKMRDLIYESIEYFNDKKHNEMLWRRFWKCIEMYKDGGTYKDVLQTYFGAKKSDKIVSHTKIYNTNL